MCETSAEQSVTRVIAAALLTWLNPEQGFQCRQNALLSLRQKQFAAHRLRAWQCQACVSPAPKRRQLQRVAYTATGKTKTCCCWSECALTLIPILRLTHLLCRCTNLARPLLAASQVTRPSVRTFAQVSKEDNHDLVQFEPFDEVDFHVLCITHVQRLCWQHLNEARRHSGQVRIGSSGGLRHAKLCHGGLICSCWVQP